MLEISNRVTFETSGAYLYTESLIGNSVVFVKTDRTGDLSKLRKIPFYSRY